MSDQMELSGSVTATMAAPTGASTPAAPKLRYRILGRRTLDTLGVPIGGNAVKMDLTLSTFEALDAVDVEWTREGGELFPMHKLMVETRVNPETLELEKVERRIELSGKPVLKDQINVAKGTPDAIILQTCEEKRHRLAESLGIEP
jgi:hypothetical protein